MFYKKKFNKLILTERYKSSNYRIQKINGDYALFNAITDKYVDLWSNRHEWDKRSVYFKDCLRGRRSVINAFNYVDPVITEIEIEIEETHYYV